MTVKVLEPSAAGHRLYYVRVLAEGCAEPIEWFTTAAAAASVQAGIHLGAAVAEGRVRVRVLNPWPGKLRALIGVPSTPSDVVVVPDGDRWLPAATLLRLWLLVRRRQSPSYRLLLMRPELRDMARKPIPVRIRRAVKSLMVRTVSGDRAAVQALGLVDAFGFAADRLRDGVVPVADPVAARQVSSVGGADRLVVGLLGAVDERKSPGLVAQACREAFDGSPGRLVVVGGISPDALLSLRTAGLTSDQLHVENRYVDEDELVTAAAGCDVIAVMYTNHDSSSGVLALAAQVGVPVLVPAGSRLAATAERGGFGVPAEPTVAGLADALRGLRAQQPALRAAAERAGRLLGTDDFVDKLTRPAA